MYSELNPERWDSRRDVRYAPLAVLKKSRGPDVASIAHTQCRPEAPRALHRACWATAAIRVHVRSSPIAPKGEGRGGIREKFKGRLVMWAA